MNTEIKEEYVLIAKRVPPSDRWSLLSNPNHIFTSLTDALEGYFQETQQVCDFKLSPIKGELYAIVSTVAEIKPIPLKKFNVYGD
jgi:hypothetical protein